MPRSLWWVLGVLAAWTAYVWVTRLFNAWSSADETTAAKVVSTLISVVFLAFVVASVVVLARTWNGDLEGWMRTMLYAFAAWTTVVWVVRIVLISIADHAVGFKVVHAALGVVSIALAVAVAWGVAVHDEQAGGVPGGASQVSTEQAQAR